MQVAHQNTEKEITTADSSGILGDVVVLNMGESEVQVPFGEVMIGREEKEVCNSEDQRTVTSDEEWEVEEAEPLYMQQQLLITEKEKEVSAWVKQNVIKLGKLLGADFQGHEEEAMELLLQVDSARQARHQEAVAVSKKKRDKRRVVKNIMGDWKADIICLQETKLQGDLPGLVMQIWGGRWIKMACLEASGTRGGIMMLWDSRIWKGEVLEIGTYTLTCKFESQVQDFSCHITGVYAPNCYVERRLVWEEIGSIRGLIEGPWAVCGDFNEARYVSEKRNCIRRTIGMREFSDLIEDLNLVDLQLENAKFTWFKGDNHLIASRIDRVLVSQEWDDAFRNLKQYTMQRILSDHSPITLQGGSWKKSKSYFKFENWWLGTEGFIDRARTWWNSFDYTGRPDYILASKLKALKHKLKEWSRSEQGNLGQQRKSLLEKLAAMENIATDRGLTEDEATEKARLLLNLEDLIKNEEIYWRQRSRSIWLKEGDKNTKFFHKIANAHKRYNNIDQLLVQGNIVQEPKRIQGEIVEFYQKLYTKELQWRPANKLPKVDRGGKGGS
ncbi:hypothetical protein MTR67_007266 [Solanum verrucosum]|uniref:Endonuclease/exonuclease/phosphatase domain-containing protein n=1 Tax=Solanum verrucosum TaxID=315347 RepID=A0AAF0TCL7_SOLVR|nr:hypothetical protein MTR67_007266 [Solanum verrucosum]